MIFIALYWNPGGSESSIRSGYNQLLGLGINAFCSGHHIEDYRDSSVATDWYDRVYRIANEMGMKVIWYTGIHRLNYKGAKTGEPFVQRYSKFPACGGFTYGDEPNYMGWDHSGCKWAVDEAHRQGASPSKNPMFAVFGYDLSVNYTKTYTPGCEIFDIGCANCYPTALDGSGWKEFLEFWVAHGYHRPNNDGFGDCGKGMIAVIQAHVDGADKGTPGAGMLPDMVGEYGVWKAKYGGQLKGIGFYLPYAGGTDIGFLESGSVAENLRNQIRELTGGAPPPPPVYTCPYCGATFSSQAELDDHIATVHPPVPVYTCTYCGATFGSQGELNDHVASEHPTPTPPGTATADAPSAPVCVAAKAFDNNPATFWFLMPPLPHWIRYDFGAGNAYCIGQYTIRARDLEASYPKNFTFQGSNDGTSWTTIDTQTNQSFRDGEKKTYSNFTNSTFYRYYRIYVTATGGYVPGRLDIAEIELIPAPAHGEGAFIIEGRGALWLLENNEWHWIPSEATLFSLGYAWADVQTIAIGSFCPKAVGATVKDVESGWQGEAGFIPHADRDWIMQQCGWEEFTTQEITCSGCGAVLELTISSIAEKNASQGCPVCGTPAD